MSSKSIRSEASRRIGWAGLGKVVKRGHRWCVISPRNPDWSGGCYKTKKEAKKRLKQVERAKHARGVGQAGRMCWETERRGMSFDEAQNAFESSEGPVRISFDERDQSWTLEVKKPCPPAHPMRRFMYRGMGRRRRRR